MKDHIDDKMGSACSILNFLLSFNGFFHETKNMIILFGRQFGDELLLQLFGRVVIRIHYF